MSSESLLSQHEREDNSTAGIRNRAMESQAEHQKLKAYNTLYTFTTSLGAGTFLLILFWILRYRGGFAWHSDPKTEFNWHPFFMSLGMIFLYSQAILIYRTGRNIPKMRLKVLHGALHFLAFIFSVIGLQAVFDSHNLAEPPIANLYTMHSWIGLLTVIIFSIQFASGFITFLYPGLAMSIRKAVMPIHLAVGTGAFIMGMISCITGFTEKAIWALGNKYSEFIPEAFVFNFIAVALVLYGLLVLYLVTETTYKRNPLPEDELVLTNQDE